MKIAYFGIDILLPCLARAVADGHEVAAIFTSSFDGDLTYSTRLFQAAAEIGCPVWAARPTEDHVNALIESGVEAFVSAAYLYKIPAIPEAKAYGVNLHPTLLPRGRSKWPLPHLLLNAPEDAGMTLHKLAPAFDSGDIIMQRPIELGPMDDLETLTAKIVMTAPEMLGAFLRDPAPLWQAAAPQDPEQASYWPMPDMEMRRIDWNSNVQEILKIVRAFGQTRVWAEVEGNTVWIDNLACWREAHAYPPGHLVTRLDKELVVAVRDGLVVIKSWIG